jgi:hypothetical protein
MTIKPVLVPDHDAADLRKLMDHFATAAQSATPAAQANRIRQQLTESAEPGVTEARPDVMRHAGDTTIRVVKKGGVPIGEIGTDSEASPGNGAYYVKLYDGSYDAVGYDTAEEALAELKAAIKQGVAEGRESDQKILRLYTGGKSPETIATQLNIDVDTVKDYIKNRMPQSDQDDRSRGYSSGRTVSQGMNEQGVTESIDPIEQLRADILRFSR